MFVKDVLNIGMVVEADNLKLACSPDGTALVSMDNDMGVYLSDEAKNEVKGESFWLYNVGLKTRLLK